MGIDGFKAREKNIDHLGVTTSSFYQQVLIQGVSEWTDISRSAVRDRGINNFIEVWFLMALGGVEIWVSSNSFQKNYIGLPQQPPTEKMLKFNMVFHDSTPKNFFSRHKNKVKFKCLDDSDVLCSDFPGLKTSAASMTSVASVASMASMTSTASFHQKI